ncbi:MAG TPA: amidase [Planctomycetaceae bacterium]|nr:amidase [Planctomycetaceae bacterium]
MPVTAELAFADIPRLGRGLRTKEFTAVELAEFALQRLDTVGRDLNAVVTLTRDIALQQAAEADRELAAGKDRGPLHGIPYGAKDLLSARGAPTTWGAAPFRTRVIDEDAWVIERLRDAGAVLVAKLAMVELAGGLGYRQANAAFTGPGRNPWHRESWSGGSSSGSGSAVGAGCVPFAIGSETWGSILNPACSCGITGLRPTFDRVSKRGAMALSWTMDKLGPMCRSAHDCGVVLGAIAGCEPDDIDAVAHPFDYPAEVDAARPPFRLALLKSAIDHVQPAVRKNFDASLEVLKDVVQTEFVELPEYPYSDVATTIIAAEMGAAFEGLVITGEVWELTAPEDRPGAHAAQFIPARDYINAQRIRKRLQRDLDTLLARFDAIATPSLSTVARPLDMESSAYNKGFTTGDISGAGNVAGLPALSVPNGFGDRGLPTGLQFVGRAWSEGRLLALGRLYQQRTDWHRRQPDLRR